MDKVVQKCLEALPGGAAGGLLGGLVAFLIWDGQRATACDSSGFSVSACVSALDTRNTMIAVVAAFGAIVGAIAVASYKASRRSLPPEVQS